MAMASSSWVEGSCSSIANDHNVFASSWGLNLGMVRIACVAARLMSSCPGWCFRAANAHSVFEMSCRGFPFKQLDLGVILLLA